MGMFADHFIAEAEGRTIEVVARYTIRAASGALASSAVRKA